MKKNFETRIFRKFFFTTPNFFFRQAILNTKKRIYIEVWYSLVRPAEDGKLPNTARLDSTPPGPFRVKISSRNGPLNIKSADFLFHFVNHFGFLRLFLSACELQTQAEFYCLHMKRNKTWKSSENDFWLWKDYQEQEFDTHIMVLWLM